MSKEIGKLNGQVHPVNDQLYDLPGYVENEMEFENPQVTFPMFNNEGQLPTDFIKKDIKQELVGKNKEENLSEEKKKSSARKLKTFEIVLKYYFQYFLLFIYLFSLNMLIN